MARKEDTGFVEQNVEKIVIAAAAVILLFAGIFWGLSSPRKIKLETGTALGMSQEAYSPDQIDQALLVMLEKLKIRLKEKPIQRVPIPPYDDLLGRDYENPCETLSKYVRRVHRTDLARHVRKFQWVSGREPLEQWVVELDFKPIELADLLPLPKPAKPLVLASREVQVVPKPIPAETETERGFGRRRDVAGGFDYKEVDVSHGAIVFDHGSLRKKWREVLKKAGVPADVVFVGVETQRCLRLPDGSWSSPEPVSMVVLPDAPVLPKIPAPDEKNVQEVLGAVAELARLENQKFILQPPFYDIVWPDRQIGTWQIEKHKPRTRVSNILEEPAEEGPDREFRPDARRRLPEESRRLRDDRQRRLREQQDKRRREQERLLRERQRTTRRPPSREERDMEGDRYRMERERPQPARDTRRLDQEREKRRLEQEREKRRREQEKLRRERQRTTRRPPSREERDMEGDMYRMERERPRPGTGRRTGETEMERDRYRPGTERYRPDELTGPEPPALVMTPTIEEQFDDPAGILEAWFHDANLKEGITYRYRTRLILINPVVGRFKRVAEEADAKALTLKTQWSDWSDPVEVKRPTEFFLVGFAPQTKTVMVDVFTLRLGQRIRHRFKVGLGEPIGVDKFKDLLGLDNQDIQRTKVSFQTGAIAVSFDFEKKQRIPGTNIFRTTTELLYLGTDGKLHTRTESDDAASERYKELFKEARQADQALISLRR